VRAREEVEKLLSGYESSLSDDTVERLSTIMTEQAKKYGETKLPYTG